MTKRISVAMLLSVLCIQAFAQDPQPGPGSAAGNGLYQGFCAMCHESGMGGRAPRRDVLATMSAERILAAMNTGVMMAQSGLLSVPQRMLLAEFLSAK